MTQDVNFDTKLIRDLAEILDDTKLTDIEIEQGDMRIRLSRNIVVSQVPSVMAPAMPLAASAASHAPTEQTTQDANAAGGPGHKPENTVTSPMVGTVYLAPSPGSKAFVEIGQQIREGETLLIVEAMKTMNHISAPHSGTVRAILVRDAQPVEFGEPLVVIE